MSSNAVQKCDKMRSSESDQFALASEPEAPQQNKPSMLRKPMFSLVPPKTKNLTETSRDEYEEQVKTLNQTIKELKMENSQLKALRDKDQVKYEQLAIYTDNLREEKSLLQVKIKAADKANLKFMRTKNKLKKLEKEREVLEQEKVKAEEQSNTFRAKISQLDEALQNAQLNANLVVRHLESITFLTEKIQELRSACESKP